MSEVRCYKKLLQIMWQKIITNKTIIRHLECERSVVKIIKSNKLQLTDVCIARLTIDSSRALLMTRWKATRRTR